MSAAQAAWASIRVQRRTRTARWVQVMRDARRAAAGKHAYAVAGAEELVGALDHRQVLAGVHEHGHLDAHLFVGRALDVRPDDAAQHRAGDGADHLARATAHIAARDHADRRAARGAHAGLATVEAYFADRLDDAEVDRLCAAHFIGAVILGARRVGARAQQERATRDCPGVPSHSLLLLQSVSPKAD